MSRLRSEPRTTVLERASRPPGYFELLFILNHGKEVIRDCIGACTEQLTCCHCSTLLGPSGAPEFTQSQSEMSTRNFPGRGGLPARKADNLAAICELISKQRGESGRSACCGESFNVASIVCSAFLYCLSSVVCVFDRAWCVVLCDVYFSVVSYCSKIEINRTIIINKKSKVLELIGNAFWASPVEVRLAHENIVTYFIWQW
jgi:hypothetical protein